MADDDDFIDIELTSSSSSGPLQNRDFEFQMSSVSEIINYTNPPADDFFYKGKLLPLQCGLPKLVNTCQEDCSSSSTDISPAESCNISPSESCRPSCERNPGDFFFHWSTDEFQSFIHNHNHYPKKLKFIKQSSFLRQKIKTLMAYLKGFFIKSAGENRATAKQQCGDDNIIRWPKSWRRYFSGVIKRHSPLICLSSSSCSEAYSLSSSFFVNSNALFEKKSSSENEISIEAAIAHCKNS